jgi:hypothetical protein
VVDSINTIGPGWRATDSSGNIITDGILAYFDAGTSNARIVYSDKDLSSSLGTTVNCNSAGYPITSGNAKTLVYTGNTPYKVRLTSVLYGGTVFEHDNVRGALDTSIFLTSSTPYDESVVNTSTNLSLDATHHGHLINANCTAGTITMTIADASALGDGWFVGISHAGTANQVKVIGDGVDTFRLPGVVTAAFSLTGFGETVWLVCDGTKFLVRAISPALIGNTTGMIKIADRLSTPPGSPTPGARYILTAAPTGAWSTFAEHDIAEANGQGGWFRYTPVADCGWIAYVQDEDRYYTFRNSAWALGLEPDASTSVKGLIQIAAQSDQETGTSTTLAVTPGTQHFHPSAAKFWVYSIVSGGVPQLTASYNVTSLTDTAVGQLTVVIANDFSSAFWPGFVTGEHTGANRFAQGETKNAGSWQVATKDAGGTLQDPTAWNIVGYGDL